jgi:hypothetical protein
MRRDFQPLRAGADGEAGTAAAAVRFEDTNRQKRLRHRDGGIGVIAR